MKPLNNIIFLLFSLIMGELKAFAQLPVCSGNGNKIIYYVLYNSSDIYNYNTTLPLSSTNPSLNSIALPANASPALAVSTNLNTSSPSPTFYTVVSGYYYYYNGTTWVNTGYTAGGSNVSGINPGAGGGYIYNLDYGNGNVYKYDGTGNATILVNVSTTNLDDDVAVDCSGNFYILNIGSLGLRKYNTAGSLITSWTLSGTSLPSGGGDLAIIGDSVYYSVGANIYIGIKNATTVNFTSTVGPLAVFPSDFATCQMGQLNSVQTNFDSLFLCNGMSVPIYAIGTSPFTWSVLNGPATIIGSGDTITVTSTANATIVVSTSATGCNLSSDTIHVLVNSPAQLAINSNSPICMGTPLHINVTSSQQGGSFVWSGPNNFYSNNQNIAILNASLIDSGYYIVKDSLHGCISLDTTFITIKNGPAIPQLINNGPLCENDTLIFTAIDSTSGILYNWTGPNNFVSTTQNPFIANVSPAATGLYTLTVFIANNCSSSSSTNVLVKPRPANLSITTNSPVCYGSALNFSANSTSSNVTYTWAGPDNLNSFSQNVSVAFTNFSDSGDYYLSATLNGCSAFDTIHAVVAAKPAMPSANCNTLFCAGDTLFLSANDITNGVTYSWTGPNGFSSTQQNPVIANTQNADSGNYIVRAVFNGCPSDPDSVTATIYQIPSDTVLSNGRAIICSNIGSIMLSAIVVQGQTYQWYENGISILGATSFQHLATSAGSYNVHIYNLQGCSIFTNSINVTVATAPIPVITAVGNVLSTGVYTSYQWTLNGNSIPGATNQTYTATQNGSYSVIVTDSNGCSGTTIEPYPINDLDVNGTAFKNDELTIYPNPVVSLLYIEAREKIIVSLSSIDGKMQMQKNGTGIIDMAGMSNSVYLLKVFNDKGTLLKVEKIIKE